MQNRLGVDIGGVVIAEIKAEGGLAHIDENYLKVPPVQGAFDSLLKLKKTFGEERYLISKARESVESNCRTWLHHHEFFEKARMSTSHLHFCRKRSGKRKICEDLEITHFVDDKLEVLSHLVGVVPNLYLFNPDKEETQKYIGHLGSVTVVPDWQSLLRSLLSI